MMRQQPTSYRLAEAPPNLLLLDACVLIDHLSGHDPARQWLTRAHDQKGTATACSVITLAELLSGINSRSARQRDAVMSLVGLTRLLQVGGVVAAEAAEYVQRWHLSHGVGWRDALIAATAKSSGAKLSRGRLAVSPWTTSRLLCRTEPYAPSRTSGEGRGLTRIMWLPVTTVTGPPDDPVKA